MSPQPAWISLSVSQPLPSPRPLPEDYHAGVESPEAIRAAVNELVRGVDWMLLPWRELMDWLLAIGRADIPMARLAEGHVDAMRIAGQADHALSAGQLYGVWASRSGATGVRATRCDGGWRLDGTIRFASGAGVLDRALVPVWTDDQTHLLADLDVADLPVDDSAWQTAAMSQSRSHTVTVDGVVVAPDQIVGAQNFYLERPGFFPGGVGVAAVWAGGAGRVVDVLLRWLGSRRWPAGELRLGRIRLHLTAATAVVRQTGMRLDNLLTPVGQFKFEVPAGHLQQLSAEARGAVATAVRGVLDEVRTVAGPAGVAYDADLTRALDDLTLYALQQNADNDAAYLGGTLRLPDAEQS